MVGKPNKEFYMIYRGFIRVLPVTEHKNNTSRSFTDTQPAGKLKL